MGDKNWASLHNSKPEKIHSQIVMQAGISYINSVLKELHLLQYKIVSMYKLKECDNLKNFTTNGEDILNITFFVVKHGSIYLVTSTPKSATCGWHLIPMGSQR
jgi:hypothetical protein